MKILYIALMDAAAQALPVVIRLTSTHLIAEIGTLTLTWSLYPERSLDELAASIVKALYSEMTYRERSPDEWLERMKERE